MIRQDLSQLFAWLAAGDIKPEVTHRIGLNEISAYHAKLEAGGLRGKIVALPEA